jgi:hypothetical protein
MSHDVTMVRAKLRAALDKIGKSNGHACPETKSNIDPALHELFIASEAASYWKKRHDDAKAAAMDIATTPAELDVIVTRVTDNMVGESHVLADGDLYMMTLDLNKPSKRLNGTALKNLLQTSYGMSKVEVEGAFSESSSFATPAKKIKVINR